MSVCYLDDKCAHSCFSHISTWLKAVYTGLSPLYYSPSLLLHFWKCFPATHDKQPPGKIVLQGVRRDTDNNYLRSFPAGTYNIVDKREPNLLSVTAADKSLRDREVRLRCPCVLVVLLTFGAGSFGRIVAAEVRARRRIHLVECIISLLSA